jgi:hypothetical protein
MSFRKNFLFLTNLLTIQIDEAEAKKLGLKDEEFEIGKFISANSQECQALD